MSYFFLRKIRGCSKPFCVKEIFAKNFSLFAKSKAVFTVLQQREGRGQENLFTMIMIVFVPLLIKKIAK